MTTEGDALAALIAELEQRLGVDGSNEFLSFPAFSLRLGLGDLAFEARDIPTPAGLDAGAAEKAASLNREDFSILVNQIPHGGNAFIPDGQLLWSVYERVLTSGILPLNDPSGARRELLTAQTFQKCKLDFDLSERPSLKGDEATYYPTSALSPNDFGDPDAWTRIQMDAAQIDQQMKAASPGVLAWVRERVRDESSGVGVQSLAIEVFPVMLARAWFEPAVLESRCWKWEESLLSNGGNPPAGQLPAYARGVILARHLRMELVPLPAPAVVAQPAGSLLAAGAPRPALSVQPAPVVTPPRAISLRSFAASVEKDSNGRRSIAGARPAATLSFPVPPQFGIDAVSAALEAAMSAGPALTAEREKVALRLAQADTLAGDLVRNFMNRTFSMTFAQERAGLQEELGRAMQDAIGQKSALAALDLALAEQAAQLARLQAVKSAYEALAPSHSDAQDVFVLAFACRKVKRSPNPDPQLFAV